MCSSVATSADAHYSLGSLIGQTRSALVGSIERTLARGGFDITMSQFLTLKQLAANGPTSAGELAQALRHDPGAMTRMLARLETKGYLRRQPDPRDRRALRIELTEVGARLWQDIRTAADACIERALVDLDAAEREQLEAILRRILRTLAHES